LNERVTLKVLPLAIEKGLDQNGEEEKIIKID
jgi:hypothetical protein